MRLRVLHRELLCIDTRDVSSCHPQIGSVIIVLHAPSDPEVETVDEILAYASQTCELRVVESLAVTDCIQHSSYTWHLLPSSPDT